MNTKTLQAITRHGEALLLAFPNATERDPVALCKKLRRIENVAHRAATDYCNGDIECSQMDMVASGCLRRLRLLLGMNLINSNDCGLFINRDARGYACKLGEFWTQAYNDTQRQNTKGKTIYTDWGQNGILAPDLNEK